MAYKQNVIPEMVGQDVSLPCASDLSASQYKFVKFSSGKIIECSADDTPLGILQNKPVGTATKDEIAIVRCFGFSKLVIGSGGGSAGDYLIVTTAGSGLVSTTDHKKLGAQLLQDAAASDVAAVMIVKGFISL